MSRRRKKQLRSVTFFIVPVMLALAALVPAFFMTSSPAQASLSPSQWDTVRGYIAEYFGGPQFNSGTEGEAGFRMSKTQLWNRIDSNGDISPAPVAGASSATGSATITGVLGEGDDMATRPVMIDNLRTQLTMVPGTEFRCNYNTSDDCYSDASLTTLRQIVDRHRAAGFSTDIVDYCVSSHTAAPTTGGFGIIAQVPGALSSDTTFTPNVYTLSYARNGWRNAPPAALAGANATAAPETLPGGEVAPATAGVACDGSATDYDLVRCQANWAISATGGNVGNGSTDVTAIGNAAQSVDIRVGTISTMNSAGLNLQIPINTLFDATSLANLDPAATTVMASRTQMGGDAAIGLKMLGYNLIAGGYINGGFARWNATGTEQQVDDGVGLPVLTVTAQGAPGAIDTTGPSVTSVATEAITATSANIHRIAGEPATMKIEYGTAPGVYGTTVNNTVLNADKIVALPSLTENTHYYYQVTSYDGYANPTVSAEGNFWTDVTAPTISNVSPANAATVFTSSPTVTADLADNLGGSGIDVDPTISMAHIDGVHTDGCVITTSSISCATTGLAYGSHTLEIMTADLAGLPAVNSSTTFNVGDNVAPTVVYTAPTGTINNQSPTITGTVTDPAPSGGLPAAAMVYLSTDGGSTYPNFYACTITTGNISCPVTDVLSGNPAQLYNVRIDVTDNDGTTGSGTGSFTIDVTAPTVTADPVFGAFQPGNWTNDTGALLSATITDLPPGQHITAGSITIDGAPCAGSVATDTSISCTATPPLAEGARTVVYSAEFSAGHPGTATQTVNVDITGPAITGIAPSGSIATSNPTLTANLSDGTGQSGINATASAIYLDGSGTALAGCTKSATQISCTTPVAAGAHTFSVHSEDNAGNATNDNSGSFTLTQINYFWTWYDNVGGNNWVLFANNNAAQDANYELSIGGNPMTLPNGGVLPAGEIMTPMFDGLLDGPVKATSTNGVDGILSQRILWPKGGNSLEEVPATKEAQLSDHYVWTWYDEQSPGYQNWILVSNPNAAAAVYYEIKIDGNVMESGQIPAGGRITPHYPGVIGGPVEVQAWSDSVGGSVAANVMASQRVLSNGGMAFNEEPGIPFSSLSSHYQWTWYDTTTPGNHNWILIANPNAGDVTYEVKLDGTVIDSGTLPAGGMITPEYAGRIGGPVEVTSTGGNVIASQRVTWGPSFEETPGFDNADLKNSYLWSWYDQVEPGVQNWVLVANTEAVNTVHYIIKVDGVTKAEGDLAAGDQVTPTFAGTIGGHVEVTSTGGNVMASQRVLWKGYFNETVGQ